MAHFRGDGRAMLAKARREPDLQKKVELMDEALVLHFREMEHLLQNLGIENFCQKGIKDIRGEK